MTTVDGLFAPFADGVDEQIEVEQKRFAWGFAGVITLPFFGGNKQLQMYGNFEGFLLFFVPCLGW